MQVQFSFPNLHVHRVIALCAFTTYSVQLIRKNLLSPLQQRENPTFVIRDIFLGISPLRRPRNPPTTRRPPSTSTRSPTATCSARCHPTTTSPTTATTAAAAAPTHPLSRRRRAPIGHLSIISNNTIKFSTFRDEKQCGNR